MSSLSATRWFGRIEKKAHEGSHNLSSFAAKVLARPQFSQDDYAFAGMAGAALTGDFRGHLGFDDEGRLPLGPKMLANLVLLSLGGYGDFLHLIKSTNLISRWNNDEACVGRALLTKVSAISIPSDPRAVADALARQEATFQFGCHLPQAPISARSCKWMLPAFAEVLRKADDTFVGDLNRPEVVHRLWILLNLIPATGCVPDPAPPAGQLDKVVGLLLFGDPMSRPLFESSWSNHHFAADQVDQSATTVNELLARFTETDAAWDVLANSLAQHATTPWSDNGGLADDDEGFDDSADDEGFDDSADRP